MSYQRKVYTLKWPESHELHGLTVTIKPITYNNLIEVTNLRSGVDENGDPTDLTKLEPVFKILERSIRRWNLTDEDGEVAPITVETLRNEDFAMIMAILEAWTTVATGVGPKLGKGSSSGNTFPEASIPMETLSPSLSS